MNNGLRIRLIVSIVVSLLMSAFFMSFVTLGDKPTFEFQKAQQGISSFAGSIQTGIGNTFSSITSTLTQGLSSGLFSSNQTTNSPSPTTIPSENPSDVGSETIGGFSPTNPHQNPTQTPQVSSVPPLPTSPNIPTSYPSLSPTIPVNSPTSIPTKVPKPTVVPKLVLEARRPGNSFEEVIGIISPIMCVPEAMLWATLENEYGAWMGQVEADWNNKNTFPGSDTTAVSGGTACLGVTQMMQDTWFRVKPYVMAKFTVSDMSLNTTFDSFAAAAYHQRNVSLAGQDKDPCDDWDVKRILYAACRYNGACPANTYGQSQYYNAYTYSVCEAYNRHSTKKKICK